MPSLSLEILLLVTGLVIIAALAFYAWQLTQKVKVHEARIEEEERQAADYLRSKQLEAVEDARFLCRSVLTDQCDITEGIMRLHYVVNTLGSACWYQDELSAVRSHYDSTSSMPILDAYKKLTAKEQFEIDKARWTLEEANKDAIFKELNWLANSSFQDITRLH